MTTQIEGCYCSPNSALKALWKSDSSLNSIIPQSRFFEVAIDENENNLPETPYVEVFSFGDIDNEINHETENGKEFFRIVMTFHKLIDLVKYYKIYRDILFNHSVNTHLGIVEFDVGRLSPVRQGNDIVGSFNANSIYTYKL